ncbi:MAG: LmbE family protein, partial [Bacteroidota bacterium]
SIWNKDSILADVVFTIRKFKPDVIICRFPTTGEGGHGHHTASAILAQEAFEAAADSSRFREQLKYTSVWKAKRLFWNTFNFGGTNTTAPNQLKIDVGVFNVLLGKSYGEIAAESRSMHKSQGFGSAKARGEAIEYFKLIKGDSAHKSLCEGQEQNWNRFAETKAIGNRIDQIIQQYNALEPEKSITDLIWVYKQLLNVKSNNTLLNAYKTQKLKECENLLIACSGVWAEANSADFSTVPGSVLSMSAQIVVRNKCDVKLNSINYFNQSDSSIQLKLNTNILNIFKHHEMIPLRLNYSNPYWLNKKHGIGMYQVTQKSQIGLAENESTTKVTFDLNIQDLNLKIERPVVYKSTDPVKGEVYRALEILPPLTILLPEKVFVFNDNKTKTLNIIVKSNKANVSGHLKAEMTSSENWPLQINNPDFTLQNKGDETSIELLLTGSEKNAEGLLKISVTLDGVDYSKSIKRIEYDHIPYQFILSDAEAKVVKLDVKMANTNIAYIPGAG